MIALVYSKCLGSQGKNVREVISNNVGFQHPTHIKNLSFSLTLISVRVAGLSKHNPAQLLEWFSVIHQSPCNGQSCTLAWTSACPQAQPCTAVVEFMLALSLPINCIASKNVMNSDSSSLQTQPRVSLLPQLTGPTGILNLEASHPGLVCWNGNYSPRRKAAVGGAEILPFVRQKLSQKSCFNLCRSWPNLINLAFSTSSTALKCKTALVGKLFSIYCHVVAK